MLQQKYLPEFQFSEKYSIVINADARKIWPIIDQMDLSGSWVIRILFALRGMPARMTKMEGMQKGRFILLERSVNAELIIGLIGQFWKPHGNLQSFQPHEFTTFSDANFLKGTWNFELLSLGNQTLLETETRVQCLSNQSMKHFSHYWFFIKPFSALIRKEILRGIKKKAENKMQ